MTLAASGFIGLTIVFALLVAVTIGVVLLAFWGGLYAAVRVARKAWKSGSDE